MRTANETLAWLRSEAAQSDNTAEELVQECDNEERSNWYLSRASAMREVIDFITERIDVPEKVEYPDCKINYKPCNDAAINS